MKKFVILFVIPLLSACTDGQVAKLKALGNTHTIELLDCNGNVVRKWRSTGKVLSESSSDGYYFQDVETGKVIEVSGTLIITTDGRLCQKQRRSS